MKTLELVFTRLCYSFKQNKSVFIFFLIGCFICSLSLIFLYGNQLSPKVYEVYDSASFSEYSVIFNEPAPYENVVNNPLLKSDIILDTDISFDMAGDDIPKKEMNLESFDDIDGFYKMTCSLTGKYELLKGNGRVNFKDDELKEGKNVIILPSDRTNPYNIKNGDKITVAGREYEVIGMCTTSFNFYIPPETFKKYGYPVDHLVIRTTKHMSRADNSRFIADIHNAFPDSTLGISPSAEYEAADRNAPYEINNIICEFIVATLSFMFLMKYIIDSSNSENIIYSMVGATRKRIFAIVLIENIVIYGAVASLACVVHKLLYKSFFDQINVYRGITYTLTDYVIIVLAVIVLSCIVSLPFIFSCLRNSIIKNKNKYD